MTAGDDAGWFDTAALGIFVHWDHASQRGLELSWPMVGGVFSLPHAQDVSAEDYRATAATFDPHLWDPVAMAARLREVGARYVVMNTKHHSGYAMYGTELSDHCVTRSPYGRDLVGKFVSALRAEGLRIGFYYSLSDWHHPDYPAWRDDMRPYVFGQSPPRPDPDAWQRYRRFLLGQLRELLTRYGRVDVLWFDGQWERTPDEWGVDEIEATIRELQPAVLVNDRLPGRGDYATPEQFVPPEPPGHRWETCMTMNESWSWNPDDRDYKSAGSIVRTFAETRSRGGNLLLNVSPRGDGTLPPEQVERLDVLGRWVARHEAAVREVRPGLAPWQFYGPSTRGDERAYLFLTMRPVGDVVVRGVRTAKVSGVRELATGRPLDFSVRLPILEQLVPDPVGELSVVVPEDLLDETGVTVLVIEGAEAFEPRDPEVERAMLASALGGTPDASG